MKKSILIIATIVIILILLGFFYYVTFTVNVDIPGLPSSGSKMLPSDFATEEYSSNMIQLAEEKISEVETKLNEVKAKDLNEYNFLHKQFLENMIDKMDNILDQSKDNLNKAKNAFEEQNYFEASDYASLSKSIANIMPRHLNNILEGRTKDEWNRLEAIETGTKSCLDSGGYWKEFSTSGEFCQDQCNKPDSVDCINTPSWSCDCGPDKCWDGEYRDCGEDKCFDGTYCINK